MSIVVDASMTVSWFLPDERIEGSIRVLRAVEAAEASVPSLFQHEVRNILLISERRGRISAKDSSEALERLAGLALQDCGFGDDDEVLALARTYRLTAYDAAYVVLAVSMGSQLATLDRAMATAAQSCGITILGPLAP